MPIRAEVRESHPAELLVLQVPSQCILESGAATSRDQAQGTIGSVARYELKPSRRVAGKATSAWQGLLHHGKSGLIFVTEVKDEGDEDDPQCEIRGQAGHPIPVGLESRRRRIWEPVGNFSGFDAATGRRLIGGVYHLHTAILNRPLSSAATKEV